MIDATWDAKWIQDLIGTVWGRFQIIEGRGHGGVAVGFRACNGRDNWNDIVLLCGRSSGSTLLAQRRGIVNET